MGPGAEWEGSAGAERVSEPSGVAKRDGRAAVWVEQNDQDSERPGLFFSSYLHANAKFTQLRRCGLRMFDGKQGSCKGVTTASERVMRVQGEQRVEIISQWRPPLPNHP